MISRRLLDSFYRKETNANLKERILLVKRVRYDKQEAASAAETELGKTRTWAYKWLHRFDKDGLDGLKDKKRTGRPPDVPKDVMVKIRQELADSSSGWDFRQVMDLIYNKTGVRYHEVHIYRLLHKWGFKSKDPKKICKYCFNKGQKEIQKRVKQILSRLKTGWNIIVQDESIFVYDYVVRRKKWIIVDKRPIVTVTGSHKKTIVFGSLSLEGKQLFKQYDKFNSDIFVDYLKQIHKKFGKCIIFVDRATPHCSKITRKFLAENKDSIKLEYFPVGFQNLVQ